MPTPDLLTVPQAAARLGVGRSTVYNLLNARQLASVKVRGCRRIPERAITTYISSLMNGDAA